MTLSTADQLTILDVVHRADEAASQRDADAYVALFTADALLDGAQGSHKQAWEAKDIGALIGLLDKAAAAVHQTVPRPRPGSGGWLAGELADGRANPGQRAEQTAAQRWEVPRRPDADVQREVRRALLLDSLVPLTVDARVRDGIVTLSGWTGSEWERADAITLASCVPGVWGIADQLSVLPGPGTGGQTISEAVQAALARTAIADLADLTVDTPSPGTVTLAGAVTSRSDHDLAIATAWSVTDVETIDDCIQVEY
jgi:osmotically-inducible protein OsmY